MTPSSSEREAEPVRPDATAIQQPHGNTRYQGLDGAGATASTLRAPVPSTRKKRNHRGGKKKRPRKKSFAVPSDDGSGMGETVGDRELAESSVRSGFYRHARNLSGTSLESEALLDHRYVGKRARKMDEISERILAEQLLTIRYRDQQSMRPRRTSTLPQPSLYDTSNSYRPSYINPFIARSGNSASRERLEDDERAPLLSSSRPKSSGYGGQLQNEDIRRGSSSRKGSGRRSSASSKSSKKKTIFDRQSTLYGGSSAYNVNYPPSVPGSPELATSSREMSFGDILGRDEFGPQSASADGFAIDMANNTRDDESIACSPRETNLEARRRTVAANAEADVCFPTEGLSEAEDEIGQRDGGGYRRLARRRRFKWPDLTVLDEWSRLEKEGRSEERRVKRMIEPQLIGGRLRPIHKGWHRAEDDAPYRFTYFNEEFPSTIHSQTISELVQPGGSFQELFIPDPPEITDSSNDEDEEEGTEPMVDASYIRHASVGVNGESRLPSRQTSVKDDSRESESNGQNGKVKVQVEVDIPGEEGTGFKESTLHFTPSKGSGSPSPPQRNGEKPKRYGDRPTWWLDVLSPTDAEMKVISKAFGIHPLTAEDIMVQEAREKVELFRNYYFVNYRTFEQDMNNEDFLEPVNMYILVFREGVLSFHFSMTPHPANVRRRIRQLKDYLILTSDWISYAIIDDITDVFAPLIQHIEEEVDDIDDEILMLHPGSAEKEKNNTDNEKRSEVATNIESGGDMLRRIGDCRKKVMGLYRLLGNKADVIKGFAKRCNEHWEVAPRSEIGLYLGDIQDHIVTMTGNLSHYEKYAASFSSLFFCTPIHAFYHTLQCRPPSAKICILTNHQNPLPLPQQLPRANQHPYE
jgi:magnesium transporter